MLPWITRKINLKIFLKEKKKKTYLNNPHNTGPSAAAEFSVHSFQVPTEQGEEDRKANIPH